ncbi:MAG TPA: NAD(P)/FAD-dependent oxidoreductase [Vicinamibacterales bacterium]|nr:NAD(P)/FAD-dependent oxidoreductase [Vicinamibacterales bacterium]
MSATLEPNPARESDRPLWDVAVIGGGPAGSTVSTMLRQLGHSVVLLEKTPHPRFHIGESLLPFTLGLMRRTGFLPILEAGDFVPKWGARFVTADDKIGHTFYFSDAFTPEFPGAYQVLRSKFDHLLLEHSRSGGTDVRENHTVRDVEFGQDRVKLKVSGADGRPYDLEARYLADATGRDAFLATKLNLKLPDSSLRKVAIFAHFKGALRDTGRDAGNTISVVIRGGWIWWIPLAEGITSIGVVVDGDVFKRAKMTPDEYFGDVLRRVPALAPRLVGAERVSPVHATSDFSYGTTALCGDRWLLLGDAGFFLDPIFSSGVHLAITSGISAAEAIHARLERPDRSGAFAQYVRTMIYNQHLYRRFIYGWYEPGFLELLLSPSRKFQLLQAVTSVLAGAPRSWSLTWRLQIFLFLVRLNQRVGLVPTFDRAQLPP